MGFRQRKDFIFVEMTRRDAFCGGLYPSARKKNIVQQGAQDRKGLVPPVFATRLLLSCGRFGGAVRRRINVRVTNAIAASSRRLALRFPECPFRDVILWVTLRVWRQTEWCSEPSAGELHKNGNAVLSEWEKRRKRGGKLYRFGGQIDIFPIEGV